MELFRQAVGEVKSVRNDKVEIETSKKHTSARHTRSAEADNRSVMASLLEELSEADMLETGEHLAYTQPGVQRSVLRKLKNGRYSVQSEIDLHGLTIAEARTELGAFLVAWLQRNKQVLAFCSARASDGGTGAVYVLLKKAA